MQLSLLQVGSCFIPVLVQNAYNLHFTHSGRQLFYEDISCATLTLFLSVLSLLDAYKKNKKIKLEKDSKENQGDSQNKMQGTDISAAITPRDFMDKNAFTKDDWSRIEQFRQSILTSLKKEILTGRPSAYLDERILTQEVRRRSGKESLYSSSERQLMRMSHTDGGTDSSAIIRNSEDIEEESKHDGITGRIEEGPHQRDLQLTGRGEGCPMGPSSYIFANQTPLENIGRGADSAHSSPSFIRTGGPLKTNEENILDGSA